MDQPRFGPVWGWILSLLRPVLNKPSLFIYGAICLPLCDNRQTGTATADLPLIRLYTHGHEARGAAPIGEPTPAFRRRPLRDPFRPLASDPFG